jgi:hypothetical protein
LLLLVVELVALAALVFVLVLPESMLLQPILVYPKLKAV